MELIISHEKLFLLLSYLLTQDILWLFWKVNKKLSHLVMCQERDVYQKAPPTSWVPVVFLFFSSFYSHATIENWTFQRYFCHRVAVVFFSCLLPWHKFVLKTRIRQIYLSWFCLYLKHIWRRYCSRNKLMVSVFIFMFCYALGLFCCLTESTG